MMAHVMRKEIVVGLSTATIVAGFALILLELFWLPTIDISFVIGGAAIAALAGYLLIDELGRD